MPVLIPYLVALGLSATVAAAVVTVIEIVALSLVSMLLKPKASSPGSQLSDGATQEYTGTVMPRRIGYGTNLVSGLNAIPPWCHGTNNQMLDQVLVLFGHEVSAIGDVYLNQEIVHNGNITPIAQSLNDGLINASTFANKIWVRRHTGGSGELIDFILNDAWPSYWTGSHIGTGLAKIFIQYQYDTTVYASGKPEVRVLCDCKKVYDPRLDTSPGAHPTNPSYIVFSRNPALCIVDYILDVALGIGEDPARIDWVAAVAAANVCDEAVAVPLLATVVAAYDAAHNYSPGDQCTVADTVYYCILATIGHSPPNLTYWNGLAQGTLTQKRYTCNTVLDCTQPYENNLQTLSAAFQGATLYSSGKWVLLPGVWRTPTFAIGDDDIVGTVNYQTAIAYANRYNAVRGQFYDPSNLYQPTEYPPIRVDADESADGEGPVWRELQQASCIDVFEAQRNAIIEQRKSRRTKTWSFPAHYGLYGIRPGDFGTLTITELGLTLEYVRCTGWKLDGKSMTVAITLEEVNPADWYDPASVVYQTASMLATPAPMNFVSDPVSGFSASGGAGGITFAWTLPPIWHSNLSVELLEAATNNITGASVIWAGVNTGIYIQKGDTTVRYYWVRVRNYAGNTVSQTTPSGGTAGLAAAATFAGAGPAGPVGPAGPTGSGGLVGSLTVSNAVLPADANGVITSYGAAHGQFKVYVGTTDVTPFCTFSLAPNGNLNRLQYWLMGEAVVGAVTTSEAEHVGVVSYAVNGTATTGEGRESAAAAASSTAPTGTTGTLRSLQAEIASILATVALVGSMNFNPGIYAQTANINNAGDTSNINVLANSYAAIPGLNKVVVGYATWMSWPYLETALNTYNFAAIDTMFAYLQTKCPGARFVLGLRCYQNWNSTFSSSAGNGTVPGYINSNSGTYGVPSVGGSGSGWILANYDGVSKYQFAFANLANDNVMTRWMALAGAIGSHVCPTQYQGVSYTYDQHPLFELINDFTPDDVNMHNGNPTVPSSWSTAAFQANWIRRNQQIRSYLPNTMYAVMPGFGAGATSDQSAIVLSCATTGTAFSTTDVTTNKQDNGTNLSFSQHYFIGDTIVGGTSGSPTWGPGGTDSRGVTASTPTIQPYDLVRGATYKSGGTAQEVINCLNIAVDVLHASHIMLTMASSTTYSEATEWPAYVAQACMTWSKQNDVVRTLPLNIPHAAGVVLPGTPTEVQLLLQGQTAQTLTDSARSGNPFIPHDPNYSLIGWKAPAGSPDSYEVWRSVTPIGGTSGPFTYYATTTPAAATAAYSAYVSGSGSYDHQTSVDCCFADTAATNCSGFPQGSGPDYYPGIGYRYEVRAVKGGVRGPLSAPNFAVFVENGLRIFCKDVFNNAPTWAATDGGTTPSGRTKTLKWPTSGTYFNAYTGGACPEWAFNARGYTSMEMDIKVASGTGTPMILKPELVGDVLQPQHNLSEYCTLVAGQYVRASIPLATYYTYGGVAQNSIYKQTTEAGDSRVYWVDTWRFD